MEKDTPSSKKEEFNKKQGQNLDALDFLATAAGQVNIENQQRVVSTEYSPDLMSMPHFAYSPSTNYLPYTQNNQGYRTHNVTSFVSHLNNNEHMRSGTPHGTTHGLPHANLHESPPSFPLKSSAMKELVESCLNSANCGLPTSSNQPFYINTDLPNLCRMSSPSNVSAADLYQKLSTGTSTKSAFKAVAQKPFEEGLERDVLQNVMTSASTCVIPEQPPTLFRVEAPEAKGSSLFETLVQESQKILSNQEKKEKMKLEQELGKQEALLTRQEDGLKLNKDDKKSREIMLVPPHKKLVRKRKPKGSVITSTESKRAYGGPPFNPGTTPPKQGTPESALCALHEHTLLKMATRGFWSGDRGPLQDVFRLARVENSDLQYNINEITEHCYNVVKHKLENAAYGSEELDIMHKHMRCYVDELDSYLERIYPVSSVAINVYLPTAADYIAATWHGIVPTGWSEYRRAVVIREVFEVLYYLSTKLPAIPPYKSQFFDKKIPDQTLYPMALNEDYNNNVNLSNNNNTSKEVLLLDIDSFGIKYSRAFEALWTRTMPHEPFLIIDDTTQLKLREYLDRHPIEADAPSENAIIVIDDKKYKAREILGYFRRGVQLVDYSKDTGGMVIDTISTVRNITITSAVRKIPPGKISKLVHADLHLENYTNAILQVGVVPSTDNPLNNHPAVKFRARKRRIKIPTSLSANKKQTKVKEEVNDKGKEDDSVVSDMRKLDSIASFCEPLQSKVEPKDDMPFPYSTNTDLKTFQEQMMYEQSHNERMAANAAATAAAVESQRKSMAGKKYWESFFNQSSSDFLRVKPEMPNFHTPDILSSMYVPPGTTGDLFSLHLMIDSYRRAAKYLMDTANHLELVARRGANTAQVKRDQPADQEQG